ncbi:hypothetical protein [Ralstonia pseudosolanacearum]|uniref:hypothetical protein n=1 Tax=Ralstonia pseudosolanacearum TaxID=1310165 RepID=UPI000DAE7D31|nr:hypothetical protein [Ralstonia pseudosolanacearum]RAA18477.1 hypothetical protein DOT79_04745 [Ralstonia pseudosolanacearum]
MKNAHKKSLTHAHMAFAISIVFTSSAIPLYLASKGNPWPCVVLFVAGLAYLPIRRRQLDK